MGDVSIFMKELKHGFSIWYNRTHGRFGTLWAERFRSVLVEGRPLALQTVAACIDLNPVRANLCQDPKDYRFCGYAEGCDYERSFRRKLLALTPSSRAQRNGLRTRYGFSSRGAVSSRIRATSLSQVDFLPG